MRDFELGGGVGLVAEEDDVDIEKAGGVFRFGDFSMGALNFLENVEEFVSRQGRVESDRAVKKIGLRKIADRFCLVKT
jgi:hypothetical protein